ncbi:hypothetical protein [Streptomyces sp. NPDC046161]|uniref:hypothetical protein n=1 Tax=Streptomyces sp. NPDC046161 TaxID=3155132 RepID=UPI0033DAF19C
MSERPGPDWARGVLAVGLLLLIVGAFVAWPVAVVGGLMILFVGVSTADQRRAGGRAPETLLRPGDRPWRRKED